MAAAATLLGFLAAAGLTEIVLTWANPFPLRVRGNRIFLDKNVRRQIENTRLPGVDPIIIQTKNSLGFRGPEPPPHFDKSLTIVAVGGSTTECFYLTDGRDWPAVLSAELTRRRPDIWVNNAGLDGHSTYGHLTLMQDYLAPLKPKVVLFLVGVNDIGRTESNVPEDIMVVRGMARNQHMSRSRRAVCSIAEHSRLFALVDNILRYGESKKMNLVHGALCHDTLKIEYPPPVSDAKRNQLLESHRRISQDYYRERLVALLQLCRNWGIEPVLITQPALLGPGIDPVTGADLARVRMGGEDGLTYWMVLETYNDVTRQEGADKGVLVIDLAAKMKKDSRYFYDHIHFTNAGAEEVARIVAAEVGPFLDTKFSRP